MLGETMGKKKKIYFIASFLCTTQQTVKSRHIVVLCPSWTSSGPIGKPRLSTATNQSYLSKRNEASAPW